MPENRQGKRNGSVPISSNLSVDYIQEAIRRLGIERHDKEEGEEVSHQTLYPDRPGEPDCIYYLRTGTCGYGSNCRFNHPAFVGQVGQYEGELPERVGQPDCGYFLKTGTCKYGSTCKYHHPRDRHSAGPVLLNILGLPMRQEEKSCPYYMRTGSCKFGVACKFDHPQPSTAGTVLPLPASYGSTSLSIMHSSGLPYAGGLPGWSLPGETYMSGPHSQGPQSYVPFVISPSQGMVPVQGWNTYTGSMSPVSSANVLGEPGHNGQQHIHQFPTSASHLPERPNQPECRYFMNTGSCKYGLDCKYNHPRDKISHVPASSLGPLGLPSRPGQAVCSYYSMYGLCKYGPTCKFDHPLMGYSYNYRLNPPTLSMLDPSFFPYQRNSSTLHLSERTSPSKSSKFSNSIKKHEASSKKNPTPDPGTPDDSPEVADSPAHSSPTSSELGHD